MKRQPNVGTRTYSIKKLGPRVAFMERELSVDQTVRQIDVYGNFWVLAFGKQNERPIGLRADGVDVFPEEAAAIFIPPHGIVEWILPKGVSQWKVFVSSNPLPLTAPKRPIVFKLDSVPTDISEQGILELVMSQTQYENAEKLEWKNPISLKLKNKLDLEFSNKKPITEYAKELGAAHEMMTRYFKRSFGLSPHEYRNKLRLFQASAEILLAERNVMQTMVSVGFENQSHFNHQFKNTFTTTPSQFRVPELNEA